MLLGTLWIVYLSEHKEALEKALECFGELCYLVSVAQSAATQTTDILMT